MALKYEEVARFARQNGNVKAWAKEGAVTLLKSGEVDSVKFWEEEAVVFEHGGKSYSREGFEKLVRSSASGGTAERTA
jgi:hypothetical protein